MQIRDQRDGLIPFDTTVTLTLHESGASGAFCNDPALLTAEVAQGEATFLGLRLSHVGKGFVISAKASSACVQDGVSAPITVKGVLSGGLECVSGRGGCLRNRSGSPSEADQP